MELNLDGKKDLLVSDHINGQSFAVVKKGDNQTERLITAIHEEFDSEKVEISELVIGTQGQKTTFKVDLDDDNYQHIELGETWVY